MPKPTKGPRLGGSPAHQRMILANLATQLFQHGKITTTETRAKRVQPLAERLIQKAKRGDLHNRRIVLQTVRDKGVVHKLFAEIAPKFVDRNGGYTRITKIGNRKGDNAPLAIIEIVTETLEESRAAKKKAAKATGAKSAKKSADVTVSDTGLVEPETDAEVVEVADVEVIDLENTPSASEQIAAEADAQAESAVSEDADAPETDKE